MTTQPRSTAHESSDDRSDGRSSDPPRSPDPRREPTPIPESVRIAQRAQAGDERALDDLFARYFERVDRIVRIRLGARARGESDSHRIEADARRDASLEIRALDSSDHASVIQWLAGLAERRILAGRPATVAPAPGMFTGTSRVAGRAEAVPAAHLGNRELERIYDDCVESLSGRRREVTLLREYARCSWGQIVAEMRFADERQAQDEYRRAQLEMAELLRHKLRR